MLINSINNIMKGRDTMEKNCFVIMPFGKDKDEKDFNTGVFESIIFPAASKLGYNVNRVDTKPTNVGNITKNIVHDLVEADIVIADMTNGNANVFYELGIRHALHKCKTVLIIQEGFEIPFDLKQHVSVFYSTNLQGIQSAIKGISEAIKRCENAREEDADNPVHEYYPSLKYLLSSRQEDSLQSQLMELSKRNTELQALIDSFGISTNVMSKELDILDALNEADNLIKVGGVTAVLEMRQCANQGDTETFLVKLKEIMQSKLLTPRDYLDISRMCKSLGLIPHRIIVLQKAHETFKDDVDIVGLLADAYSDHPAPEYKQKGRLLIEEYAQIEYFDGKPNMTKRSNNDDTLLMGLFNVYLAQRDWDAIVSVCDSAIQLGYDNSIYFRNKARALVEKQSFDEAEIAVQSAIDLEPDNDALLVILSDIYQKKGDFEKALTCSEKAIQIDPDDATNYINLAIDILNRGFLRNQSGNIIGPLEKKKRLNECLPILAYALKIDDSPTIRNRIVEILSRKNAHKEAIEVASIGKLSCANNSYELEYILKDDEMT